MEDGETNGMDEGGKGLRRVGEMEKGTPKDEIIIDGVRIC